MYILLNWQIKVLFSILWILLFVMVFINPPVRAQNKALDVSFSYKIADPKAVDGDILVTTDQGTIIRSNTAYASRIFGVLQNQPLVSYKTLDSSEQPIVRNGVALVNVTSLSGDISAGDYITSSNILGKGQKATVSGYVLGVALKSLNNDESSKVSLQNKEIVVGKIPVAVKIEFAEITTVRSLNRYFDALSSAFLLSTQTPDKFSQIIRYIAAALTTIIGFVIGFFILVRSLPKSIEAVGRNPLAKNTIQFFMILNIVFAIISIVIGVSVSFVILRI